MRRTLIIMVKEPHAGRVKTRLGRDIGMTRAAWWFRHQARRTIRTLRDPRWQIVLAVTPDRAGMRPPAWPANLARLPQGRGDLGDRMARLLRRMGPDPTVLIGADIPGVTRLHLSRAFRLLGQNDVVLGPAEDGGYWLIGTRGANALPPGPISPVRWSTTHALEDTVDRLAGRRIGFADRLQDVDTAADLNKVGV